MNIASPVARTGDAAVSQNTREAASAAEERAGAMAAQLNDLDLPGRVGVAFGMLALVLGQLSPAGRERFIENVGTRLRAATPR